MTKSEIYRAERDTGKTYRQIAELYGVSYQNVQQACVWKPAEYGSCIYPQIKKWMNDNRVKLPEMAERMCVPDHSLRKALNGSASLKKEYIDALIALTGIAYEELFKR